MNGVIHGRNLFLLKPSTPSAAQGRGFAAGALAEFRSRKKKHRSSVRCCQVSPPHDLASPAIIVDSKVCLSLIKLSILPECCAIWYELQSNSLSRESGASARCRTTRERYDAGNGGFKLPRPFLRIVGRKARRAG